MRGLYLILICLGLLSFPFPGRAQNPIFYPPPAASKLPSHEVYSLQQDDFGFIWMGCNAGLFRYDGFTFQKFSSGQQNSRSISFLNMDQQGRLWCKNFSGQVFCVKKDALQLVSERVSSAPALPHFSPDQQGNIWIQEAQGFQLWSLEGTVLEEVNWSALGIAEEPVNFICANGALHVLDAQLNISRWELDSQTLRQLPGPGEEMIPVRNLSFCQYESAVYILAEYDVPGQQYGVFQYRDERISRLANLPQTRSGDRYYSIFADAQGVWVTGSSGVFHWPAHSQQPTHHFFPEYKVSSMLKDREGLYWFSTLHNGILIVPSMEVVQLVLRP